MNFVNEIKYLLHRIKLRKSRKKLLIENKKLLEENNKLRSRIYFLEGINSHPVNRNQLIFRNYVAEIRVPDSTLIINSEETCRTGIPKYLADSIGKAISADLLQTGNIKLIKLNDCKEPLAHTSTYRAETNLWFEK